MSMKTTGKYIALRNGVIMSIDVNEEKKVDLVWFQDEDRDDLLSFYRSLPKEDRLYLRDDVTNQLLLDRLIEQMHDGRVLMLVGRDGSRIVGETTQHFIHHGWTRHVSELRPLIHKEYEGHGILESMVREQIEVASELGLDKVVVRLLDIQTERRRLLEKLGFEKEASLRDHATDLQGNRHNMIIMSNYVSELWRRMEDLIRETDLPPMPPPDL
jgi:RimJ/RimL family protein N-acetyltransferase